MRDTCQPPRLDAAADRQLWQEKRVPALAPDPYLARWLLITAALFAASALVYAFRLGRAGRARTSPPNPPEPSQPVADR
ncbi:MAG: hypothetical protein M3137_05640 [Actinomycetota bacterium]|nr:hypothetical protein [Actinomycetota bacterium]